ncbi:hypothetical protein B0H10DRAFT_1950461 [Mycena sp. CBHHK59/15]|nr:hypothetical protein B0H10DRAFT_1950461 [Mycena sp. CBHHK59/15]
MGSDDDDRVSLGSEELGEDDSPTREHTLAAVVPVGTAVASSSARPMTEQSSVSFGRLSAVNEWIAGKHDVCVTVAADMSSTASGGKKGVIGRIPRTVSAAAVLERASAKKDSRRGNTVAAAKQETKSVRRELLGVIEKLAKRVESSESGSAQSKMEIQTLRTKLGYLDERLDVLTNTKKPESDSDDSDSSRIARKRKAKGKQAQQEVKRVQHDGSDNEQVTQQDDAVQSLQNDGQRLSLRDRISDAAPGALTAGSSTVSRTLPHPVVKTRESLPMDHLPSYNWQSRPGPSRPPSGPRGCTPNSRSRPFGSRAPWP